MGNAEVLRLAAMALGGAFALCTAYQLVYLLRVLWHRERPLPPGRQYRYAVLICARNEQAVIGQLLDSVFRQDYPAEKFSVFVAADNCTDATAAVAREKGAFVYERTDAANTGKGYALQFLLEKIRQDHGDCFDGFFVFDADNLLRPDYITQMDCVFSRGYDAVTSFRNAKNYGDNWISAGYGLWFLRDSEYLNHARHLLGVDCVIGGTGFLFSAALLRRRGGWHFHLMTEDTQFTAACILAGERIGYCAQAEFFDEQPTAFRQAWRQRLRWVKGYIQVLRMYGRQLVVGAFGARRPGGRRQRAACYDMLMAYLSMVVCGAACAALQLAACVLELCAGTPPGTALLPLGGMLATMYGYFWLWGMVTTVAQWRRIHTGTWRRILYVFTFPLFMMTYLPISVAALFCRVEWEPIQHMEALSLQELECGE